MENQTTTTPTTDAETRAWAHNHNASIVAYSEKVLQDSNNVVSSKELKWRDKF